MDDLAREKRNARRRELYANDPEHRAKRLSQADKWKGENRDYYLEQQAEVRRDQYATAEGKARLDANNKRWEQRNPGKRKQLQDSWYERNGKKYHREWAAAKRVSDPELFIWRNARNRAKEKGLAFSITLEDIVIPDVCPVLGISITKGDGPFLQNSPSLDRHEPSKGYVPGNVFVMSNRANILKRDGTLDEFKKIVAYMESHP